MTVLLTADTVGGVWTYAVDLARALRPRGVTVHLATMGRLPTPEQRAEARAAGAALHESAYALEWMSDPWEDVRAAGDWLLDLERAVRPDVVHLNGYAHGALPWTAPVVMVGHSCVLSWWRAVKGADAPPEWDRYARAVERGLRAADVVLAPTAAMLRCLEAHYGPLRRAAVVPNGRDAAAFRPRAKEPFVFSAGRFWDEAKNLATLDAAADGLPWPVEVAGDMTRPDGGEAAPRRARALGRLSAPDIAERMGRAGIYALPARYEPFGLSALEAALCGCALVLGDIPTLREVWGDAALFVPPDDACALRAALSTLIKDPRRREAMAAAARERARLYTPERMALGIMAAYGALPRAADARKEAAACAS